MNRPVVQPGVRPRRFRAARWVAGGSVAVVVCLLQWLGVFSDLDHAAHDAMAVRFGRWNPPPSGRVALAVIDDRAIETIGRWPWSRDVFAQAIEELSDAGAGVIAVDVLFDEPQRGDPGADQRLAAAIASHGKVVLASRFPFRTGVRTGRDAAGVSGRTVRYADVREAMRVRSLLEAVGEDGEVDVAAVARLIAGDVVEGFDAASAGGSVGGVGWGVGGVMADVVDVVRSVVALERAAQIGVGGRGPGGVVGGVVGVGGVDVVGPVSLVPRPPLVGFVEGALSIGNVSVPTRGRTRVPVFVGEPGGRYWLSLGPAAVAAELGLEAGVFVDSRGRALTPAQVISSGGPVGGDRSRRDVLLPVWSDPPAEGLYEVQWPVASAGFLAQFEHDRSAVVPLGRVVEARRVLDGVSSNISELDRAVTLAGGLAGVDIEGYAAKASARRGAEAGGGSEGSNGGVGSGGSVGGGITGASAGGGVDDDARVDRCLVLRRFTDEHLGVWTSVAEAAREELLFIAPGDDFDPASLGDQERAYIQRLQAVSSSVPVLIDRVVSGLDAVEASRAWLRERVGGRIVFIGFAATGLAADVVPTAIDERTPGVFVHAAMAENVLTGFVRWPTGVWWGLLWAGLCAGVGGLIGSRTAVYVGPMLVVVVGAGWVLLSGVLVYDGLKILPVVAGPMFGLIGGWLSVLMERLLVEQRSRRRTEARFRAYVPPDVVDILVANPKLDSMAPKRAELTVLFADLEGFTTMAERLGPERTSEVLNTFLAAMTDELQRFGATLDKYLGDAIMAFWGAPLNDPEHALHACEAARAMLARLDALNAEGVFGDAAGGVLRLRVGLASGPLMVGDFGSPPRRSSYTVIGDAANLAARLESANRYLGTRVLMSERTHELLGGRMRTRCLGRLRVKGKVRGVGVHELLGGGDAGAGGEEVVRATAAVVEAYEAGRFEEARGLAERLAAVSGHSTLAAVYLAAIERGESLLRAGQRFDGTLELSEK